MKVAASVAGVLLMVALIIMATETPGAWPLVLPALVMVGYGVFYWGRGGVRVLTTRKDLRRIQTQARILELEAELGLRSRASMREELRELGTVESSVRGVSGLSRGVHERQSPHNSTRQSPPEPLWSPRPGHRA
jgi:hypothetical protein